VGVGKIFSARPVKCQGYAVPHKFYLPAILFGNFGQMRQALIGRPSIEGCVQSGAEKWRRMCFDEFPVSAFPRMSPFWHAQTGAAFSSQIEQ